MEDELRPEYDLRSLRVRKVGSKRTGFNEYVRLAPDVAEVFPNAESVNEALRFLIRVTRGSNALPEGASIGRSDLVARGIDEVQAADLRGRLAAFVEEWDSPEMDVYDNYDATRINGINQ